MSLLRLSVARLRMQALKRRGLYGSVNWMAMLGAWAALCVSPAAAATFTWSPDGADGGTGTWDTTLTNWNAGAVAWPTSGTDNDASFAGTAGTVTISGGVTVNDLSFQTDGYTVTGGTMTLNGTTPTIGVTTGTATIGSTMTGSAGMAKTGSGSLVITTNATFTGTATIAGGSVRLQGDGGGAGRFSGISHLEVDNAVLAYASTNSSFFPTTTSVAVRNGGVLDQAVSGAGRFHTMATLTLENGASLTRTGQQDGGGSFRIAGGEDIKIIVLGNTTSVIACGHFALGSTGILREFNVADGAAAIDLDVSAILVNNSNGVLKTGAGTMQFRANNAYTGSTVVQEGRLLVGTGGAIGTSASFTADGGTLSIANNLGNSLNAKALTVQDGGIVSMENTSNNWTQIGGLTLANGGTLSTTGANDANGTFQLRGDVTVSGNTTSTIAASLGLRDDSGTRIFDVADGTAGIDLLVSSFIANGGGGITSGLTKTGAGRMVLSGQNTYTGTTEINAGSLIINGSVGGDVVVAAGATLGGSGVLGRTLSGAGLVSVGNSPGIGTAGAVDPSAGTDWVFEITGTAPVWNSGTSASVNDVLRLTDTTPFLSNLSSGNTVDVLFALSGGSPLVQGDYLGGFFVDNALFDLSAALANGQFRYWVVGEYGSAGDRQVFNVGANGAGVTYSLLAAYDSSLTASYTVTPQTVDFGSGNVTGAVTQFVVVPEPASLGVAAIGIGLAGWARFRRRRVGEVR
jgi:fibronectin-binding autotransporter adhesin